MDFSIYLQSIIDEHGLTQNGYYPLLDLQVQYRKGNGALAESLIPDQQLERLEVLAGLRKFAQKGHVLLLGKPGSGKSTALRQLRWELAQTALSDEKQSIPVLVTLRSDRPLTEAICAEFRRTKVNVTTEGVNNLLFDDRLFLLLDGLNEIPSLEREQQIRQFRKDNPKTSMVFTSRELGIELGIEQKLEMCGLTEPQIRSFVEKELAGEADAFLRQLSSRLWELSEMPLLLKWLCDVFDPATQKIPQSTGELFQAVDTKFNTWKKDKEGVTATPDFWHWNQSLLQYLAFEMLRADDKPTVKRFQINKSEAEDLLENFLIEKREESPLSKAKRWLQDLLNHHLLQIATYANQIEFCHPLFQEYYAAEYLLKEIRKHPEFFGKKSECKYVEFQQKYLNLLKWTESIALMQSLVNEQEAVQIVALALQVDWVLGARLAGEVKPDFQFQTVLLVSQLDIPQLLKVALWGLTKSEIAVPALVEALSHQKDFEMRGSAAVALGKIKSEKSISGLNQAIADKKSDVRWWVTHALGQIGSEEVILPLIQVVTEDKSSDVRFKAAEALGINRSEAAISALLRVSIEDESSDVRWEAAEALGKIGSDKAIPGLLKAIEHSRTFQLSNAAYALGKIGSATAISGLLKLKNHPDYLVRQNIAYAFGNVSSDQAIPFLLELLQDNEPEVRRRSAEALGKIGSKNTISALLVATGDKDPDVQWLAAKALVKIDSEVATPILCHLIDHPKSWVRKFISDLMGEIGADVFVPILIERIEKLDNPAVINNVAEALGKIKPITAIPDLSNLLEHQNPYIRGTAAKILGEIRSKDAIPALLKAVENNSEDFSIHEILIALGKIGSEDAVPTLLEKMTSPYSEIRANAATALGEIGSEDAISVLLKAIENEEEEFAAERILTALGKIGSEDAIPTLLEKIKSPSSGVRANAARALGKIGSKDTIPTLLKALKDDYFIRKKVALAFSEFQGDRAAHILPDLLALIPTNSSKEAFRALQFIQSNCNFYSYEIWQSDTQESTELMSERNPSIDHVISNIDKNVQVIAQHTQATAENIEEITQSAQATAQNTQVATQHTQATAENTQLAAQNMRKIARDKMPLIAIIVALFIMFITMNVSGAHNQEFRDLVKWLMHQVIRQEVTKPVDSLLTGGKNLKDATLLLKEWANLINLRTSNISPGKYELSLISLTNTDQIPGEGQDLVFVAKIGESYHIRIFDEAGKIIFGHENSEFSPEQELKEELEAIFQGSNPNTLIAIDDEAKAKFISIITSTLKRAQQSQ